MTQYKKQFELHIVFIATSTALKNYKHYCP